MTNPLQIAIPPSKMPDLRAAAKAKKQTVELFVTSLILDAIEPGPVTIAEVAKAAGVSTMSASYALRGMPQVSKATQERVKEVAERLGYRPSAAATALQRRRKTPSKGRKVGSKNRA